MKLTLVFVIPEILGKIESVTGEEFVISLAVFMKLHPSIRVIELWDNCINSLSLIWSLCTFHRRI